MMKIRSLDAYQIFDSRGNPTVECAVGVEAGLVGYGRVPCGASTGQFEALELRDNDPTRYRGKSVFAAINHITDTIARAVVGREVCDQDAIDASLIELDGTENKSRLGANAILAVSLAVADAGAKTKGCALFEHLGSGKGSLLPLPGVQIVGGGAHAHRRLDIQDFLLVANCARSYEEALEVTHNVYRTAAELLSQRGLVAGVADEGGYWPQFAGNEAALEFIVEAIRVAGYAPGKDCSISLDFAASNLFDGRCYRLDADNRRLSSEQFIDFIVDWCRRYPIISIEDPLADDDWVAWRQLGNKLRRHVQIVGDDLFTTNVRRIQRGIEDGVANAVLIKPNQIGTVSETLAAIEMTKNCGWQPIISARSGETEDAFIAHLAVATNAGQIKVGSFSRGERMSKWNELIRIGRVLGERGRFRGARVFDSLSPLYRKI